jgi:hypothetical protein
MVSVDVALAEAFLTYQENASVVQTTHLLLILKKDAYGWKIDVSRVLTGH